MIDVFNKYNEQNMNEVFMRFHYIDIFHSICLVLLIYNLLSDIHL